MSSEQAGDGVEVQSSFQVVEDQQNGEAVGSRVGEQGIAGNQKAPENELLIDGAIPSEEIAPTVLVPAEEATESGQIEIQQHQQGGYVILSLGWRAYNDLGAILSPALGVRGVGLPGF